MNEFTTERSARASGFFRTDLASELKDSREAIPDGVSYREYRRGPLSVTRLRIETREGAAEYGREPGTYVTVTAEGILYLREEPRRTLVSILASELREMAETLTEKPITEEFRVLVAGLGNAHMTADALGSKVVRRIPVTHHLESRRDTALGAYAARYARISAVAPGVLGDTGIEASAAVASTASAVRPDVVVAVDALAARDCHRLAATVQLSDAGISPGSGIGGRRTALDRAHVGVPVIALGVPTVVDSATLVSDALARAGIGEDALSPELLRVLESGTSFFVSPKEIDALVEAFADLLGEVIEHAFSVRFYHFG